MIEADELREELKNHDWCATILDDRWCEELVPFFIEMAFKKKPDATDEELPEMVGSVADCFIVWLAKHRANNPAWIAAQLREETNVEN